VVEKAGGRAHVSHESHPANCDVAYQCALRDVLLVRRPAQIYVVPYRIWPSKSIEYADVMVSSSARTSGQQKMHHIPVRRSYISTARLHSRHYQWECACSEERGCCELQDKTTFTPRRPSHARKNAITSTQKDRKHQTPNAHHIYGGPFSTTAAVDAPNTKTPPENLPAK
jgi:hypothetical protein